MPFIIAQLIINPLLAMHYKRSVLGWWVLSIIPGSCIVLLLMGDSNKKLLKNLEKTIKNNKQ